MPTPPVPPVPPPPYLDVSGNGDIGPQDVLIVINYLNGATAGGAGEGEAVELVAANLRQAAASATWTFGMRVAQRRGEPVAAAAGRRASASTLGLTVSSHESESLAVKTDVELELWGPTTKYWRDLDPHARDTLDELIASILP